MRRASSTSPYNHYYIASYRAYTSYDAYLRTGPYNFGFNDVNTNKVEHFPYQDGLLISYWDTSFTDNNTSEHPGGGPVVWRAPGPPGACDGRREGGHAHTLNRSPGLELDAYFSATKLQWLLENVPGARERARQGELCFGTIDSWLAFKLCGRHVTDVSNASRTMLYNIHSMRWDPALLDLFGIPEAMLPEVVRSSDRAGVAREEWFGHPIPLSGIAGDQQAATFGQACFEPGMMKSTYGTGCFALLNTGATAVPSRNRLLTTVAYQLDGKRTYALEGAREAILEGAPLSAMWDEIWPLLIIGAVSIPLGLWVFSRGELYAKRLVA